MNHFSNHLHVSLSTIRCVLLGVFFTFFLFNVVNASKVESSAWAYENNIDKKVDGRVLDNTGQPVIGATVLLKGSLSGTITDINGEFTINVPDAQSVLVISFIGYETQEITVGSSETISITLQESNNLLKEVVVVGYQTITRKSVTTAVASMESKDITPTSTNNVAEALQGKVPGLQVFQGSGNPGAQPKLLVRGFATITGGSNPLIVVDGVVTSFGGLNDINPNDIERVDVLKDAAATAIYGSRGGSGVLLITTKKGVGKTKISFSGTSGVNSWNNPNLAQTSEFVDHYSKIYAENKQTLPDYAAVTNVNTDWWGLATKASQTHNYNLSASGSRNGLSFYAGAGYFNQTSQFNAQLKTGDYTKITARFNIDYEMSKAFKMGVNLAPRVELYGNGGGTGINGIMQMAPNIEPYKSLDQTNADVNAFALTNPTWNFTAYNPVYSQYTYSLFSGAVNPLGSMARNFNKNRFIGTQGSTYLEYKPIEGLTIKSTFSGFYNTSLSTNYDPKFFIVPQNQSLVSGVSQSNDLDYRWQIDNTVNYVKSFNNIHTINILAGQSADSYTSSSSYLFRQDVPYDAENYRFVSAGATLVNATGGFQPGAAPFGKMSSYFGRASYDYKGTLFVSGSLRADGSSLLSPKNRWGYFPTVSAAYVLSNEKIIQNLSVVDYLKLRASYGRVGGNLPGSVGAYQSVLGVVDYTNSNRERGFGYSPLRVPDPNIRWETTEDITLGLDMDLFNNKISITFDKYWRAPKDMLLNLPIQPSLGYPQGYIPAIYTNVGNMKTSGFEGGVNYKNVAGALSYGIGLTFQKFISEATDLKGQTLFDEISNDVFQSTRRTKTETGDILGQFYGFNVLGVFQNAEEVSRYVSSTGKVLQPLAKPGDFIYENADGNDVIDLNDRVVLGNPYPKISLGSILQASYKNFDFRTELYASIGNSIANDALVRMNPVKGLNFISGSQTPFWTGEGSTNTYPRLSLSDPNGNFTKNSSFFIQDGSYMRVKLIQLGYTLPQSVFKKDIKIRIYASAQNLFTITKYEGLNPEVPFSGILRYGIDNGQTPIAKFTSVGINANF
ncbi:MAG: SusC/RagA family TonB-linked outer membrane protein [Saprospiraceae bacterium]